MRLVASDARKGGRSKSDECNKMHGLLLLLLLLLLLNLLLVVVF